MKAAAIGNLDQKSPWRPVRKSAEVSAALEAFEADRYRPRPDPNVTYYFLPIDDLPWPASSEATWRMNDVQSFFIECFGLDRQDYPPNGILFACTQAHGDVVIVPGSFLRAADLPRTDA